MENILSAACNALVDLKDRAAADDIASLLEQPTSAMRRTILTGALARLKTDDPTVFEQLGKQLDSRRSQVRQATIQALVNTGDPRAIDVLLKRREKEEDSSRMLRAIDDGVATLRTKEHNYEVLTKEVDALKSQNRSLEDRLKKLEEAQKKR
jgi:HEAT repeat protein